MKNKMNPEEEKNLQKSLKEGEDTRCPWCEGPLACTPIPPRGDVAYVRDRVLLECGPCALRLAIDRT